MSIIGDQFNKIRSWFWEPFVTEDQQRRYIEMDRRRDYRSGKQKRFLKIRTGQPDDNLTINFTGLVIDRSVTLLFGKGVQFDLPGEDETPEDQYIQAVMDANKQQIMLHKAALLGSEQGTCYLKIIPDAYAIDDEKALPRLVVIDPAWITMDTNPHDYEDVIRYIIEYTIPDPNGREKIAYRQVIERDNGVEYNDNSEAEIERPVTWTIKDYESTSMTGGKWQQVGETQVWEYEFPPVLHWQNLPDPCSPYGVPDVTEDVIDLQDRVNFLASNISKIIRLYAHPMRYGRNLGDMQKMPTGPDDMLHFKGGKDNLPEILQLSPVGDLATSASFLLSLRQALFDITQTVDISSMSDKIGALTNFGLRVLYQDALAKLGTKRELYGDALLELVRRLLVIGGFEETDPGSVVWPDPLPADERVQGEALKLDLELGLVSKHTAALERGYDWDLEQERMSAQQEGESNVGAQILRAFNIGR